MAEADLLEIDIDLSDLEDWIEEMEEMPRIWQQEAGKGMRKTVDTLEQAITTRTPVNTGLLRGSIATSVRGTTTSVMGEVMTPLFYGIVVEVGRRPGRFPPIRPIQLWVIRKGIAPVGQSKAVAFLIARAIARRGTEGAFMFTEGVSVAQPFIDRIWVDVLRRIIIRLSD
jgi:hypothetical protein